MVLIPAHLVGVAVEPGVHPVLWDRPLVKQAHLQRHITLTSRDLERQSPIVEPPVPVRVGEPANTPFGP